MLLKIEIWKKEEKMKKKDFMPILLLISIYILFSATLIFHYIIKNNNSILKYNIERDIKISIDDLQRNKCDENAMELTLKKLNIK